MTHPNTLLANALEQRLEDALDRASRFERLCTEFAKSLADNGHPRLAYRLRQRVRRANTGASRA